MTSFPVCLACNNGLVGDGFVGLAGPQCSGRLVVPNASQPRPSLVDLCFNRESHTEIGLLRYIQPRTKKYLVALTEALANIGTSASNGLLGPIFFPSGKAAAQRKC